MALTCGARISIAIVAHAPAPVNPPALVATDAAAATNPTDSTLGYVLRHNDALQFDRLLLAAAECHPHDRSRSTFAFRTDLRLAVKLALAVDVTGPLGEWMVAARVARVDWDLLTERLADRWDAEHLAAVAADVAAESGMYDERAGAADDELLPHGGWSEADDVSRLFWDAPTDPADVPARVA